MKISEFINILVNNIHVYIYMIFVHPLAYFNLKMGSLNKTH